MSVPAPHFLLFSEAAPTAAAAAAGHWRFVLKEPGGDVSLEASDNEQAAGAERLELLAIVRGLEALDQPSKVTLMTGSRDIQRGLSFGLSHWREHDWQWERYGQMTPVKNADLWQRIDRLLEIHDVACRPRRLEGADDLAAPARPHSASSVIRTPRGKRLRIDKSAASSAAQRAPRRSVRRHSAGDGEFRARRLHPHNLLTAFWLQARDLLRRIFRPAGEASR